MSDIGLIKQALGAEPNDDIVTVAEELDKKKRKRELWNSPTGKETLKDIKDDCASIWVQLFNFEQLSDNEIRGLLAKSRSNMVLLNTLRDTTTIDEVQDMLDELVKKQAEQLRR